MEEAQQPASVLLESPKQKKKKAKKEPLPLFPPFTFSSIPNFICNLQQQQRNAFLASMLSQVSQMSQSRQRQDATQLPHQTVQEAPKQPEKEGGGQKSSLSGWQPQRVQPKTVQLRASSSPSLLAHQSPSIQSKLTLSALAPSSAIASTRLPKLGKQSVEDAKEKLAYEVNDYARGNEKKAKEVVGEFCSRLKKENWKAEDLMAVLLLVIEDNAWGGKDEPEVGSSSPAGSAMRVVPERLRQTAQESAHTRLASVREMLRYYFLRHPADYSSALASALGLASDQEDDITCLQERLAYELAAIGSFALAQKILAELKKKKGFDKDTRDCLLKLGYYYDEKSKKLVLGKRTCGKPAEAKGIAALLLGKLVGKRG